MDADYYDTYQPTEQDLLDLEQHRAEQVAATVTALATPPVPAGYRLMTVEEFRALVPDAKILWLNARGNAHRARVVSVGKSSLTYKTKVGRAVGGREWSTISTFRAIVNGTMVRAERETGDGLKLPLIVPVV